MCSTMLCAKMKLKKTFFPSNWIRTQINLHPFFFLVSIHLMVILLYFYLLFSRHIHF
uniref:Uncharacterized protein n=1 Tax=Octopus bimaculoides TaxID=37653 RepID=A0A0L8H8N8_OCTBM